jgi:putative membrane protein
MTDPQNSRLPQIFDPKDPRLKEAISGSEEPEHRFGSSTNAPPGAPAPPQPFRLPTAADLHRGIQWGAILVSTAASLLAMSLILRFWEFVWNLFLRQDWIGWLAVGLAALLVLSAVVLLGQEIVGLFRLHRLRALHASATRALAHDDEALARRVAVDTRVFYSDRPELAWARAKLAEHDREITTGLEQLRLIDRELIAPLDGAASGVIAQSARRVAVVTAITPFAVFDMAYVLYENIRMLRRVAAAYGGRPGLAGALRLGVQVFMHVVATGGLAATDDLLGQFIGQGLAKRLSARAGQGMFNGSLTARLGVAAIDLCRPLPFIEVRKPRYRDLALEVARGLTSSQRDATLAE